MAADGWGFAQDPDTDLGEPIAKQPDPSPAGTEDPTGPMGFMAAPRPRLHLGQPAWVIAVLTLVIWLALGFGIGIAGQQAAGVTPDWRLGLVLAAVSMGGGVDITTHQWALTVSSGPLLPGAVVIGLWTLAWALRFSHQTRQSGVPLRPGQVGQSAAVGLALFLVVAVAAKGIGSLITVNGQQVWISPSVAGMVRGALALPLASLAAGVWFLGLIPEGLSAVLRRLLLWIAVLGAAIGVFVAGLALSYGANPLALVLLAPVVWATGIAVGSGAPVLVQVAEGSNAMHASWGLGGVSGTLPVGVVLPVAAISFIVTAVLMARAIRDAIIVTGQRRQSGWVIATGVVVMALVLWCSHLAVVNQIAGTTPPPVIAKVANALHNAMAVPAGSAWALTAFVSWPVAVATLLGLFAVAAGIGVAMAGKPAEPWSGQDLEASLRKVHKAGLIDQVAFDRGMYALNQAKKQGRKRRTHDDS